MAPGVTATSATTAAAVDSRAPVRAALEEEVGKLRAARFGHGVRRVDDDQVPGGPLRLLGSRSISEEAPAGQPQRHGDSGCRIHRPRSGGVAPVRVGASSDSRFATAVTSSHTAKKAFTQSGSNCFPDPSAILVRASAWVQALL